MRLPIPVVDDAIIVAVDHRDGIACADHRVATCEFENDEPLGYAVHFQTPQEVVAYMARRWPKGRPPRPTRRRRVLPKALRTA